MGRRLECYTGKILGLLTLLENESHREALEYDLITLGLRLDELGTPALTWRDLYVVVRQSPLGSALARSTHGDDAGWGLTEHLLAMVADNTAWLMWAKTKDAARGRNRPEQIPRPGVTPRKETQRFGGRAIPLAEMAAVLGWDTARPGASKGATGSTETDGGVTDGD